MSIYGKRWDDLSMGTMASNIDTGSGRIDYNYFNGGIGFQPNARYPNEPLFNPIQAKHSMVFGVTGAVVRPHIHWIQTEVNEPNWLLAYKLSNYNTTTTIETDFTNYTLLTKDNNAFTYTSGNFLQITNFGDIDISGATISSSIDIVLFRDTTNVSTLFAGSDPVSITQIVKFFDVHAQFNDLGSAKEFVK